MRNLQAANKDNGNSADNILLNPVAAPAVPVLDGTCILSTNANDTETFINPE